MSYSDDGRLYEDDPYGEGYQEGYDSPIHTRLSASSSYEAADSLPQQSLSRELRQATPPQPQRRGRRLGRNLPPNQQIQGPQYVSGVLRPNEHLPAFADPEPGRNRSVEPTRYAIVDESFDPIPNWFFNVSDRVEALRRQGWTPDCDWSPTKAEWEYYQRIHQSRHLIAERQAESGYQRTADPEQVNHGNAMALRDLVQDGEVDFHDHQYEEGRPPSPSEHSSGGLEEQAEVESEHHSEVSEYQEGTHSQQAHSDDGYESPNPRDEEEDEEDLRYG